VYFMDRGDDLPWLHTIQRIAHPSGTDPVCSVLSCSFYFTDGDDNGTVQNKRKVSAAFIDEISKAFADAAVRGHVTYVAQGDIGSDSKVGNNPSAYQLDFPGDGKAHVQYPGSDPWVVSVGGTVIGNVNGLDFDTYTEKNPWSLSTSEYRHGFLNAYSDAITAG
jgi:kumamolisin